MYTIDRFEGDYAVLEDSSKQMSKVQKELLPAEAKEGDCLKLTDAGYLLDPEATRMRKERIRNLMASLFEE